MKKKPVSDVIVSDPGANAVTGTGDGTEEVSEKISSEPSGMSSEERQEFGLWRAALEF
jgi:hypothetical protein